MKILYLCLIVIHSLFYETTFLQGELQIHKQLLSAAFSICISDLTDRCKKINVAKLLPTDYTSAGTEEHKLLQLSSALTYSQDFPYTFTLWDNMALWLGLIKKHMETRTSTPLGRWRHTSGPIFYNRR